MDLNFVTNLVRGEQADILIYTEIKSLEHGAQIAAEIEHLDKVVGVRTINVRINSPGGNLFGGLSIYLAIKNSLATVNTYIEGVAASIAGVIAMAGQTRYMNDFGRLMIHLPNVPNGVQIDDKMQKALDNTKEMLLRLFQNNTNKTIEELDEIMTAETWYNSNDAINEGFVDRIINTDRRLTYTVNEGEQIEAASEIWAIANTILLEDNKQLNKQKPKRMDLIKNELNLDTTVNEEVVVNSITDLKNSLEAETAAKVEAEEKTVALEVEAEEKDAKIEELENKLKEVKDAEILAFVDNSIKEGKYEESAKEDVLKVAQNDFEGFKTLTANVTVNDSIINQLKPGSDSVDANGLIDGKLDGKSLRDLEKENPTKVAELKNSQPDVYNAMYEAEYLNK